MSDVSSVSSAIADASLPTSRLGAYSVPSFAGEFQLKVVAISPPAGVALDAFDPFVILDDRDRFTRTFLAHVVGPAGRTLCEVALRVQRDDYGIDQLDNYANPEVDAQWRRQFTVWRAAGSAGAAPIVLDVLPLSEADSPPLLPPLLYCKARKEFFVAPCPSCAEPLRTCRDAALLRANQLPAYDTSLRRFLYCPACHTQQRHVQFYALLVTGPLQGAPVRSQIELFRDFGERARKGGSFPCFGCESVPACYPEGEAADNRQIAGDVVRKLVAVSFHDFYCLPLAPLRGFYLDEFQALAGGRPLEGLQTLGDDTFTFRVGDAVQHYGDAPRYAFQDDPQGKLPLEILRIKLLLFMQVVSAVGRVQGATKLPHLGIAPDQFLVELVEGVPGVPLLWNFRTRLLSVGGAPLRRLQGLDHARLNVPLLDPPPLRDALYGPRHAWSEGAEAKLRGTLAIASLRTLSDGATVINSLLASDNYSLAGVSAKDLVRIDIYQTRPVPVSFTFFGYGEQRPNDSLEVRSIPTECDSPTLDILRMLQGAPSIEATFGIHRCLHVPDDMQSLGLLWLILLAANSEQPARRVIDTAWTLANTLKQFEGDTPGATAESIEQYAISLLERPEAERVFAPHQLFDRPSQQPDPRGQIEDSIWHRALLLGLRALTQTANFGFCRRHDDFDPEQPQVATGHLKRDLDILGTKLDTELLGMGGKRAVYRAAIAAVSEALAKRSEVIVGGAK